MTKKLVYAIFIKSQPSYGSVAAFATTQYQIHPESEESAYALPSRDHAVFEGDEDRQGAGRQRAAPHAKSARRRLTVAGGTGESCESVPPGHEGSAGRRRKLSLGSIRVQTAGGAWYPPGFLELATERTASAANLAGMHRTLRNALRGSATHTRTWLGRTGRGNSFPRPSLYL